MIELLRAKVYWALMFADTDHLLAQCEWCHIAKGDYMEPKTQQGTLTANQPLELLCIDFTKADPSKGGKENILVLTDAFSKFSQAFVTSSQKAIIVAKLLVEKWFSIFGVPARIHSDQGQSSVTRSFLIFAKCMASDNQLLCHTILVAMLYANGLIILCLA